MVKVGIGQPDCCCYSHSIVESPGYKELCVGPTGLVLSFIPGK